MSVDQLELHGLARSTYLSSVDDGDLFSRAVTGALLHVLHRVDDVHALDDIAKDDLPKARSAKNKRIDLATHVLAIEPRGRDGSDEELGPVGVATRVGHREATRASVLELEVLIRESSAIDGLPGRFVSC